MGDMIDRDAATAAFAAWLEDQRQCIPAHGWEFAAALQNDNPLAALPAVTVGVKPLRYFIAQGETVDQVREHARAHPLAKEGDMKLVWVNEGDLYDHSIFLAALEPVTQPTTDARLRAERLEAALRFYADEETYETQYERRSCGCCTDIFEPINEDKGAKARAAITKAQRDRTDG